MNTPSRPYRAFSLLMVLFLLSACSASQDDEIHQWMQAERAQTQAKVTPIAEPKQFKPMAYSNAAAIEPFSSQKLTQVLQSDPTQTVAGARLLAPELKRRKEPLEAYPLDSMTLVGHLNRAGQPVALVMVNNLLYQVRPGEYLGLNYGKVTRISETEVALREIVQDAVGEWIERAATLQLQEKSK